MTTKTKDLEFDLKNGAKFGKKSVSVVTGDNVKLKFTSDIAGQVVYTKSGNNIVVTAYGTKTESSSTVVDTTKVLGTVTYKNAAKHGADAAIALDYLGHTAGDALPLLDQVYILKAAKKVTGSTLKEEVTGTKANETFNLMTGADKVNFDVIAATSTTPLTGFGHDTVKVSEGENLTLNFNGLVKASDSVSAVRSGDNIVVSAERAVDATETYSYKKTVTSYTKITTEGADKGKYTKKVEVFAYNFGTKKFEVSSTDSSVVATKAKDTTVYEKFVGTSTSGTTINVKNEATYDFVANNAYSIDLGQVTVQNYANKGTGSVAFTGDAFDGESAITKPDLATIIATQEDATHKGNKFTGTSFADKAESTAKNETFSLGTTVGTGEDKVTFAGSFGKDTVNFVSGEKLELDFKNPDGTRNYTGDFNYSVKGNDVVISANVKYYATATVKGSLWGNTIPGGDAGTEYKFELAALNEEQGYSEVYQGKYMWKATTSYGEVDGKARYWYLDNSLFTSETVPSAGYTITEDGATAVDFKVYKVVDGKETEITGTYVALAYAQKDKTGAAYVDTPAKDLFDSQISGQVTVKNYMKLAEDGVDINEASLKTILQGGAEAQITVDYSEAKKGQTIKGTFLNEKITGSKYADKIYSNGGTDTITGGKGDDKMYAGTGADTFKFAVGDAAGKKGDTIYNAAAGDAIAFGEENDLTKVKFAKSGNNLVVTHTNGIGSDQVVDNVTLSNYFKADSKLVRVNTKDITDQDITVAVTGKGKIEGTDFKDVITGSAKADKITTGAGADTITAGKGNDTITIDGAGAKVLNFDRTSGKDTVVVDPTKFTSANLVFDGTATYTYDHSVDGNDLIINAAYAAVPKSDSTPAQKASTATVTVKDYFADAAIKAGVTVNGAAFDYATATLDGTEEHKRAEGDSTIGNSIYNVTASAADKVVKIFDKSGNDLYNVGSLTASTYINDKAGKDSLNINADADDVGVIFDVLSSTAKTTTSLYKDNSLFIFDYDNLNFNVSNGEALGDRTENDFYAKGDVVITAEAYSALEDKTGYEAVATTTAVYAYGPEASKTYTLSATHEAIKGEGLQSSVGGVEVADFISVAKNGKYSVGSGAIETINVGDETWSAFSSRGLNAIKAEVASWLSENHYESAMDVIETGSKEDIQALIAMYNTNYEPQA